MSDRHTVHLHDDYADGSMAEKLRSEIDRHTADCSACREDLDMIIELKKRLAEIEAPDPGDRYFQELTDKILYRTAPTDVRTDGAVIIPVSPGQQTMKTLIRVAAAVTLLFGSFYASAFLTDKNQSNYADSSQPAAFLLTDPIALPDAEAQAPAPSEDSPSDSDEKMPEK
ncbi:MAG: zf-HC2 domain-containing protein [Candidatus Zixiibacteriota bacterium]